MTSDAEQRGRFLANVVRHRTPCLDHFELTCAVDVFPEATPGQFIQVLCEPPVEDDACQQGGSRDKSVSASAARVLRRPFSIAGLRRVGGRVEIEMMGRIVGEGSKWLDGLRAGDRLDFLGPLGHGFTPPPAGAHALLVAGGVGLPPVRWLGEKLRERGVECAAVCGAASRDFVPLTLRDEPARDGSFTMCAEEFSRIGISTLITTDDGSCGLRGRTTDGMLRYLSQSTRLDSLSVYACGPDAMLQAVGSLCIERGIPCELSMERFMACGVGACQSCVVSVEDPGESHSRRFALCCTEGPVFEARRLLGSRSE